VATVDWGDGTATSTATLANGGILLGTGGQTFSVNLPHAYAEEGTYTITTTLTHEGVVGAPVTSTATVGDASLTGGGTLTAIAAQEGNSVSLSASFGDTDANGTATDYTATVDWGDGHSTSGTVTPDGSGGFNVQATSSYVLAGSYTAVLTVADHGSNVSYSAQATISDAALGVMGTPTAVTQGSTGLVARFTDAGGILPAGKYSATINWGDGSVPSAGSITISGNTILGIGSHTYANPGSYRTTFTLNDVGGNSAIANSVTFIGTPTQVYVERTFLDLLHRPVKPGGLSNWSSMLDQQAMTSQQFVASILQSQEYRTLFVQQVYDKFLRRPVATGGLNTSLAVLAGGSTPEQFESTILASDEYFNKEGGGTNTGFLQALYPDVLGRPINPAALPARLTDLANLGRQKFALSLLTSQEFDIKEVDAFYQLYLHRLPQSNGLQNAVNALLQGGTSSQLTINLVGSSEYIQKAGTNPIDVPNQGIIQASPGQIVSVGNLTNSGTVFADAGGVINIGGNFSQAINGVTSVAIGGTAPGQFGQIVISGAAMLSHTLNISFVNGFVPSSGQSFKIMTYGSHAGIFDVVHFLGLPTGLTVSVQYNAGDVTLVVN
jgi:hypothetical protein